MGVGLHRPWEPSLAVAGPVLPKDQWAAHHPVPPTQLCGLSSSRSDVTAFLLLGTRPGAGHGE